MKVLLSAALTLVLCNPTQELKFAPEAELELTKTYASMVELTLEEDEVTILIDGEEQDASRGDEIAEVTIQSETSVVFTDRYETVEDGKAQKLKRTFGELTSLTERTGPGQDGERDSLEREGTSELSESVVSFEWDEEEGKYKTKFLTEDGEESDKDEILLEGLVVDADYTALLPEEEVEVEGTWILPGSVFDFILNPSGELNIEDEDSESDGEYSRKFTENLDGELEFTLVSVEKGLATITFEGEVTTEVETEGELPEDAPEGTELTHSMSFVYEVEGKLVWNVNAHHAVSMKAEGDLEMTVEFEQTSDEFEVTGTQIFRGKFKEEATFEQ